MESKLVSVILPAYNSSKYIEYTIKSLQNQTYSNIEIIVIDDGSKDNTLELVQKLSENDSRIKIYKNGKNHGLAYTTNRGISLSQGEYIVQADHDDLSLPNRIEVCYNYLETNQDITGISGRVKLIDSKAVQPITKDERQIVVNADYEQVNCEAMWGGIISNPTIMYRKSITKNIPECYNITYRVSADMDFFEKTLLNGAKWICADNILIEYRRHATNTSRVLVKEKVVEKHIVLKQSLKRFMPNVTDDEAELHVKLACRLDTFNKNEQKKIKKLIEKEEKCRLKGTGALSDEDFEMLKSQQRNFSDVLAEKHEMGTITLRTNLNDVPEYIYRLYKQRQLIEQFFKTYVCVV